MAVAVQELRAQTEWWSLKQVCEHANFSVPTGERLKASGRLPRHAVITSKLHRFCRADVEAWLAWGCPSRAEFEAMKAAAKK